MTEVLHNVQNKNKSILKNTKVKLSVFLMTGRALQHEWTERKPALDIPFA